MKKPVIFIFCTLLSYQASAQFSSGSVMIGGSINYSRNNEDFDATTGVRSIVSTYLSLSPRCGFALSEKSIVGVSMALTEYGYTNNYQNYFDEYRAKEFSVGPSFRQYVPLGDRTAFFFQGLALYKTGKTTDYGGLTDNEEIRDSKGFTLSVSPGVNYFLNDHWALEATLGSINYTTMDADASDNSASFGGDSKSNSVNFNLGLSSFTLGLNYIIKR